MGDLKTKAFEFTPYSIDEDLWKYEINAFKERREKANARLKKGFLDAPEYSAAVKITSTNVYKVCVPGYFMPADTNPDTGFNLAIGPSPDNVALYSCGDKGCNKSIPLLPGEHTYACVSADAYFVPAAIGTCLNLHPDEYIFKVGTKSMPSTSSGISLFQQAQEGEWYNKNHLRSMIGRWVIDERIEGVIKFYGMTLSSWRDEHRYQWLESHGIPISYYYPST